MVADDLQYAVDGRQRGEREGDQQQPEQREQQRKQPLQQAGKVSGKRWHGEWKFWYISIVPGGAMPTGPG